MDPREPGPAAVTVPQRRGAATDPLGRAVRRGSAAAAVLLLAACAGHGAAAGRPGEAPGPAGPRAAPSELLTDAVTALDSADHETAVERLERVRHRCGPSPAGARAALLLAAVRLDPRNPAASPQDAAELAAAYLRHGVGPAWSAPLARVLYLEALEKGAEPPDPLGLEAPRPRRRRIQEEGCRSTGPAGALSPSRTLPTLPGSPLADRLRRLKQRIATLEKELARIREILDEP